MSGELTMRLRAIPHLREALDALPPKMLALGSDAPATPLHVLRAHAERSPAEQKWPGSHTTHSAWLASRVAGAYVPCSQYVAAGEPAGQYEPSLSHGIGVLVAPGHM